MLNAFNISTITTIIATLSFILSLWNFLKDLWESRSKLNFIYKSCMICEKKAPHKMYFEFCFENNSTLPITISRMFLKINDEKAEFPWVPTIVYTEDTKENSQITAEYQQTSERFPHTIDALGVWAGFFAIITDGIYKKKDLLCSNISLIVHTNRGIKKYVIVPHDSNVNFVKKANGS